MTQAYSDQDREDDDFALPDLEVFELTAREFALLQKDTVYEYQRRPEFRLASMNSRDHEAMIDAIVEEEGIQGGWFYWYCFPGCLPDSEAMGPYATRREALAAARED